MKTTAVTRYSVTAVAVTCLHPRIWSVLKLHNNSLVMNFQSERKVQCQIAENVTFLLSSS